jgi:hypothetical protein
MSMVETKLETIGGGVEAIHIIPLEEEIDRAVRVFEVSNGYKANKVYLLTWELEIVERESVDSLRYYSREVYKRLQAVGVEAITVQTNIFDLMDVITKVSHLVKIEREKGNVVYVNMSAGGPFVSVGTAIASMVQDARLYYVRCQRYSHTKQEKLSHGNAIVTNPQVHFLENFNIMLPDERGVKMLIELYKRGEMRTSEVLEFLYDARIEGFTDEDPSSLSRRQKMTLLMRLNKGVTQKLEDADYISKEKLGRENIFRITESGKYVACVSGYLTDAYQKR